MSKSKTTDVTGFTVTCPDCLEDGVYVELYDLSEVKCRECGSTFTPEECLNRARAALAQWEAIVRWMAIGREIAGATGEETP